MRTVLLLLVATACATGPAPPQPAPALDSDPPAMPYVPVSVEVLEEGLLAVGRSHPDADWEILQGVASQLQRSEGLDLFVRPVSDADVDRAATVAAVVAESMESGHTRLHLLGQSETPAVDGANSMVRTADERVEAYIVWQP